MSASVGFRICLVLMLGLAATDAWAGKRGVRVDSSSNWNLGAIGTSDCPGTVANSILVTSMGYTFSGRASTPTEDYKTNDYCEVAVAGTLNSSTYFHFDETALATLFGDGVGITGIRYSFLDNDDPFSATGFQWAFYTFPSGATLVALYGLDGSVNGIVPDATSYISSSVWDGTGGNYDGQYFCFQNNGYIGTWDGIDAAEPNSACLNAARGIIFANGFE